MSSDDERSGDPEHAEGTPSDGVTRENSATGLELSTGPESVPPADADPPVRVEVHPGREVVVEFDPALTFECVPECTWCCHHGVFLYGRDYRELAGRANLNETTTRVRGEDFVKREPKDRDEFVDVDGRACTFLAEDGRCALHAEYDWKPTRCSVFPLGVRKEDGDLHAFVREDAERHCDGLGVSERRVVEHLDAFLPELLWELENPDTERVL
ncbi:MAG: YkgJ family cysteine cluster protein [Halobacteriales archaeon]